MVGKRLGTMPSIRQVPISLVVDVVIKHSSVYEHLLSVWVTKDKSDHAIVVSQDSTNLSKAERVSTGGLEFTLSTLPDGGYTLWKISTMDIVHNEDC